MMVTTCFLVIALRGNHPSVPTCHDWDYRVVQGWLFSVSRSRGRSEKARPFRTSTRLRIAVGCQSHTLLAQRGSVFVNLYVLRIAADVENVNESLLASRASRRLGQPLPICYP